MGHSIVRQPCIRGSSLPTAMFYDPRRTEFIFRPDIEGRMSQLTYPEGRYARLENAQQLPSCSCLMNSITTFPFQRCGNYESSDTCVTNNASDYARPTQFPEYSASGPQPFPHKTAQSLPSSQTLGLSAWDQVPQPSYPSTAIPSECQIPHIEETPCYVNARQLKRILKWRVARQRLKARLGCVPGSRRPYVHESRHKHAMRRPRGPGGRFLNKNELERQRGSVPKCLMDSARTLETRIGPNTDRMDVERTDSLAALPRDHWGKPREVVRNGSQNNETDKLEARQSSNIDSESQLYTKGFNHISKAMTSSFYGAGELEVLRKRFDVKTAPDV
jgi:hypothetical protein